MEMGAPPKPALVKEDELAELHAVLASRSFGRAPALGRVLEYICSEYFAVRAGSIKEHNIAVEALGRRQSFSPSEDSIVRVEVSRIRKRLQQYSESEGADHKPHITLAGNGHVPEFVRLDLDVEAEPTAADPPMAPASRRLMWEAAVCC